MNEICVNPAAVGIINEEDGQTTLPEVGDAVAVTVEGKVSRVDAEQVWIAPELINGEPVPKQANEDADMDAMMAQLEEQQ